MYAKNNNHKATPKLANLLKTSWNFCQTN